MYNLVNVVANNGWLEGLKAPEDLRDFIRQCGCDGAEVIRCLPDDSGIVTAEACIGYHLMFYPNWLDFWREDTQALSRHFDSRQTWEEYYGVKTPQEYAQLLRQDMDHAQSLGARYVVFHVSDVSNEEILNYRWEHTNLEVIDASAELLNLAMDGRDYSFELLLENLWVPGMTLLEQAQTQRMLERVDYDKKGIMLDTGHLMCTDASLENQRQALEYVGRIVGGYGDMLKYFRGMHLHQSVSGDTVREMLALNIEPEKDFYRRYAQSYGWLLRIDRHLPVTEPYALELLELVQPEYLVHELAAPDRQAKMNAVRRQLRTLGRL